MIFKNPTLQAEILDPQATFGFAGLGWNPPPPPPIPGNAQIKAVFYVCAPLLRWN